MPHRSDQDWDYVIVIFGVPPAVAQREDSWKTVKDVVRNLIDGQPKKVELNRLAFWCEIQSQDDAIQAHEGLAGRNCTGSYVPGVITARTESVAFLPAKVPAPLYDYRMAHPAGFAAYPPMDVQPSALGHHPARQTLPKPPVQRRQIIVQNLHVGVKEHWLKDLFSRSIGPVQECRIEERGDKKRHALVSFSHAEHAQAAINRYNEKLIAERKVHVRLTKEVQEGPVIIDGSGVYG
ncbi:MAG: hypothetical protein Q9168_003173 [Polycauliona sp. 1 TL-2023]